MKAMIATLMFMMVLTVEYLTLAPSVGAADNLLICRPCSRDFADEAKMVIEELGLQDKVVLKLSSCFGECEDDAGEAAISFRGEVYNNITRESLKELLKTSFEM